MKIYFNREELNETIPRHFLAEWIKPIFPKKRHSLYGLKYDDLILSKSPDESDILIIPLTWNYYFEIGELNKVLNLLKLYYSFRKPIFTWVHGDYTYRIPEGDFIVFQHNIYKSKRKKNEYSYPVIISDPINELKVPGINIFKEIEVPSLGFCGLADISSFDNIKGRLKELKFRLSNKLFRPYLNLNMPLSGTRLRSKILKKLINDKQIDTNFIIRSHSYKKKINKEQYKFEYWNNMMRSPFILCIRGTGNFSKRFFEALALGKIPILIDTDCVLPFDNFIEWNNHCLIIDESEHEDIPNIMANFINTTSVNKFKEIQIMNRNLWIEYLSFSGFYYSAIKRYKIKLQ